MKMKKLSVKALMSLILSAILFCMPVGAFFANRANKRRTEHYVRRTFT